MNIQRPRASVLSLFDPLHSPPSPPRQDVDLPVGSPESDKENDTPPAARMSSKAAPGATTAFFDRGAAARAKFMQPQQPRALHHRLVDVGDETMDIDGADDAVDIDMDFDSENVPAQTELPKKAPAPARVPFAELAREVPAPPTPQKKKMHAHSPFRRSPLAPTTPRRRSPRVLSAFGSPFAAVIDAINSEEDIQRRGLPGGQLKDTSYPLSFAQDSSFDESISIASQHDESFTLHAPIHLLTASAHSSASPAQASPGPSSLQPSAFPDSSSSSFTLKPGGEASFDLMNDRMSFVSIGNESMLRALEAAGGAREEEEEMLGALARREVTRMKREGAWTLGDDDDENLAPDGEMEMDFAPAAPARLDRRCMHSFFRRAQLPR